MRISQEHVLGFSEARDQGYSPLTSEYCERTEGWMLENVIADMVRGGIDWCVVRLSFGTAVWRKHMKKITNHHFPDL